MKLASSYATTDEVLIALCSPVTSLLGISDKDRQNIGNRLLERDPRSKDATKLVETSQAEIDSISKQVRNAEAEIDAAIATHRKQMPEVMAELLGEKPVRFRKRNAA
ncbi:hypothetical protein ACFL0S_10450 [Thermodesulfobacteriota bacterium]